MTGQPGANNPSLAAGWTDGKIHTGERPQHVLPGGGVARGIVLPVFRVSESFRGLKG